MDSSSKWDILSSDLTELILSKLPIPTIILATSVCKSWNSIIHSRSFETRVSGSDPLPWLFISGQNNKLSKHNPLFAFIPESNQWIKLQNSTLLFNVSLTTATSNEFIFITSPGKFIFKSVLSNNSCRQTALPSFSTCDPLIGAFNELPRFIAICGGTDELNIEASCLAMEIYNPSRDSWERCPSLPEIFKYESSARFLSLALFQGHLYVFGIQSCFISSFDFKKCSWSNVRTLRPPGVLFSYLISCGDQLILAGSCRINGEPEFNLWRIDETTFEFREIGVMPDELASCFFGIKGERNFSILKCVGSGNFVYVFSQEHERNFPACVCEIISTSECRWRRIANLPDYVTYFHKVVSFCSDVSLQDVIGNKEL